MHGGVEHDHCHGPAISDDYDRMHEQRFDDALQRLLDRSRSQRQYRQLQRNTHLSVAAQRLSDCRRNQRDVSRAVGADARQLRVPVASIVRLVQHDIEHDNHHSAQRADRQHRSQ
jgi:hypothetical protein